MAMPETRKPRDHMEVRCARTNRLVGWIKGIETKNLAHEPLLLADPDDVMVIEDERGVVEKTGFQIELDTVEITQTFTDFQSHEAVEEVYRWVPSYAAREKRVGAGTVTYTWIAVSAEREDLETLFDFDEFEPWGEVDKALCADELEFHAMQLVKQAKSHLKGSYWPVSNAAVASNTVTNAKIRGANPSFAILDELASMDDLMSALPFDPPAAPSTATALGSLSKSLQDLGKVSTPLSKALDKAAKSIQRSKNVKTLGLPFGRLR